MSQAGFSPCSERGISVTFFSACDSIIKCERKKKMDRLYVGKIHAEVSCTVLGDISLSEFLSVPTNTMSQPPVVSKLVYRTPIAGM